jgi:hypothetical protein
MKEHVDGVLRVPSRIDNDQEVVAQEARVPVVRL